jgi:TusA-related sulfurtransferase
MKKELDVRDFACPMPIIKTSIALKKAKSGDVFVVTANDEVFHNDIKAWCEKTNNILESLVVSGEDITATIIKK